MRCPTCGEENPDRAKYCLECGTALGAGAAPPSEARKVVTIVFVDMAGSTAIGERLDPEALRQVQARYFDAMAAVIDEHGGSVEKYIGDAVMAVFGIPQLHEDDALRAVRAARGMQAALVPLNAELARDHGIELQIRIGVNTGEVVTGDVTAGQRLVTGDTVNVAARLESAAAPGTILLGDPTFRLVRDAVQVEPVEPLVLKGKSDRVRAHRLLDIVGDAAGHERHLDSPMVGREKELDLFRRALERAATDRTSHLFTLLGAAGVGKSRLVREFLAGLDEATVLRGRCLSYGEGITYYALAEIVREAAGISEEDDETTASRLLEGLTEGMEDGDRSLAPLKGLLGLQPAAGPEDTAWATRRLFEHLSRSRPVVVVVDDLHWAEPLLLDLVQYLADWTRDAVVLLVCIARPELLELRPGWGGGALNATSILLEPLASDDASVLLDNLLGESELPGDARDRILTSAEGNPLFVEEMIGMLIDDGLLRFDDGVWRAVDDLAELTVPPTIQLLLAARLDRLDAEERAVIERGAVEGKVFHVSAVASLTPESHRPNVRPRLLALARKELIRPDRAGFAGDDAFRFRHLLIRDAAYDAMPKGQRAELHERFAAWLEEVSAPHTEEYVEILAHHLEQAYRYRAELGTRDDALGDRASLALQASADRQWRRGDSATTVRLLERAVAVGTGGVQEAAGIDLAEAYAERARFPDAVETATSLLRTTSDPAIRVRVELVQLQVDALTGQTWRNDDGRRAAARLLAEAQHLGDVGLEDRCLLFGSVVEFYAGRSAATREIALQIAPRSRQLRPSMLLTVANGLAGALIWGPLPVAEAGDLPDTIERTVGGLLGRARAAAMRCVLASMRDDAEAFDAEDEELDRLLTEMGMIDDRYLWSLPRMESRFRLGRVEEAYRWGLETKRRNDAAGEKGSNSTNTAQAAYYAYHLGSLDEAAALVASARSMAAPDDFAAWGPIAWVEALLSSASGDHDVALEKAAEAERWLATSDYLAIQAEVRLVRAQVTRAAGQDADGLFAEAIAMFEAKGDVASARRAAAEHGGG